MRLLPASQLLLVVLVACSRSQPPYRETRLPSGKEIKVLAVGQMHFSQDKPALMLKYQTDLSIDSRAPLDAEVREIWESFRTDVEKAGLSNAIISVNEAPRGRLISTNRSYNFIFQKQADGSWKEVGEQ